MNKQLRTRLPAVTPVKDNETLIQVKNMQKQNQAFYHKAEEQQKLEDRSTLRVYQHDSPSLKANWSTNACVDERHHTSRSYIIKTEGGQTLGRNQRDL